jgi:hypothetical protein
MVASVIETVLVETLVNLYPATEEVVCGEDETAMVGNDGNETKLVVPAVGAAWARCGALRKTPMNQTKQASQWRETGVFMG